MCTFTNPRTRNCRSPSLLLIHAWQNSTTLPRLTTTCPISAALYVQVGSNNSRPRRRCCSNAGILVLMVELALERHVFAQRGKRLEYFTIAWNRSEERRVGKECRARWWTEDCSQKERNDDGEF